MLAWLRGPPADAGCSWPADTDAPDADDPTLACGPKDPTAPAVVAVPRPSAKATVHNVASSTTARPARPPAGLVLSQRTVLISVLPLCSRRPQQVPPERPTAGLRISPSLSPTPIGALPRSAGGRVPKR